MDANIDHASKLVMGYGWDRPKKTLKSFKRRIEDAIIHKDQDGVYIGHRWLNEIAV